MRCGVHPHCPTSPHAVTEHIQASRFTPNSGLRSAYLTSLRVDDRGPGRAARWLANNLPPLLNSPEYPTGSMVIFVMWDEGLGGRLLKGSDCTTSTDNSCHVPLLVISPYGTPAIAPTTQVNHYSVLKATENLLGLPELGQATTAPDLRADYGLTPTP